MFCLLRDWALQAVSDLPFRYWLSETGEVLMSSEQNFDIIEERLSFGRIQNCDRTDSNRCWGRSVIEERAKSENGQTGGRMKDSLSEDSEENFEFSGVGSEIVRTKYSNQDETMRSFQNVLYLLNLSEQQAEQLGLSMLGEVNREEQVGINYRYDQRTGLEIIVIPSELLEKRVLLQRSKRVI